MSLSMATLPTVIFSGISRVLPLALYIIENASARVILSPGRNFVFVRDTKPASAASSAARHIQSFLIVSQKYLLHVYHSGSVVPRSLRAMPATSARVIVSSRR